MNKEKQKPALSGVERVVHELRFPEFENDGEWEVKKISKVCEKPFSGGTPTSTKKEYYGGNIPFIRSAEINKDRTELFLTEQGLENSSAKMVDKGDVLVAMYGANSGDVGVSKIYGAINQAILCLRSKKNNVFLYHYLTHSKNWIINKYLQGGQGNLSGDIIKSVELCFPKNPKEQQKIANCLSSLDNLLTAETEKLDHLKDHKKGLLQQLFPAKGETKPQFRFPEFENDGDWEETTLDDVADYENGKAHEKEISETGKYKVVNSKFISTDGKVVKFTNSANLKAKLGDVLMVLSDIPNGKAIAKCFYVDKDDTYTVNQRICKITPTDIDNKFLFYIQNRNSYFLAFDDGVKQTNLRKDDVLSFPFLKPKDPKEQQKIANCLSSADNLIQSQTTKIEALKEHKKGLMQQLFPNVNESAV